MTAPLSILWFQSPDKSPDTLQHEKVVSRSLIIYDMVSRVCAEKSSLAQSDDRQGKCTKSPNKFALKAAIKKLNDQKGKHKSQESGSSQVRPGLIRSV